MEVLQFPDAFQDCSLIPRLLPHFPNLTKVYLDLSTVKVLRSFAQTMSTSGPISFQHLCLETQFDFPSSLEACVLDNIPTPSQTEMEQIKILKDYLHWEDYVKENQIQLPLEEEEQCGTFGLSTLIKKLKSFSIIHRPRTLRLPKGPRHWIDDAQPEYSSTVIGFEKYPFSKAVENECPPTMKVSTVNFDVRSIIDYSTFLLRYLC